MTYKDGPFIQSACFCDNVIEDKTGTLSIIRMVDVVDFTTYGENPPEEMPPQNYPLKLVITMKSGKARGRSTVQIVPEKPDGSAMSPITATAHFDGEEKGVNFVMNLNIKLDLEGLYWFHVFIADNMLTSIPLRVRYNRVVTRTMPAEKP